jgi:hypothetical protein
MGPTEKLGRFYPSGYLGRVLHVRATWEIPKCQYKQEMASCEGMPLGFRLLLVRLRVLLRLREREGERGGSLIEIFAIQAL